MSNSQGLRLICSRHVQQHSLHFCLWKVSAIQSAAVGETPRQSEHLLVAHSCLLSYLLRFFMPPLWVASSVALQWEALLSQLSACAAGAANICAQRRVLASFHHQVYMHAR